LTGHLGRGRGVSKKLAGRAGGRRPPAIDLAFGRKSSGLAESVPMAKIRGMDEKGWFSIFDVFGGTRDLARLREGMTGPFRDAQDEWGMTGLHLCVSMGWLEGVQELLRAGADTELRYYMAGTTALYTAVQDRNEAIVRALLEGGANPDAANYYGKTPREWSSNYGLEDLFEGLPVTPTTPEPLIQNAEHLADHYHPRFRIPSRSERESLKPGQAVDLHVLGPKQPRVKVRIRECAGSGAGVRYTALLDPPEQDTNLRPGTTEVTFGPEHVATVYVPRPPARKPGRTR
jgi:hypothetical protein